MRWTPQIASAMLQLRGTYLNDDLDDYWTFHSQRDQQRLPPTGYWWSTNFMTKSGHTQCLMQSHLSS